MYPVEHNIILTNGYPDICPAWGIHPVGQTKEHPDPLGIFEAVCREYKIPARITEYETFGLPYFSKMEFDGWRCRYCGIIFRGRL